MVILKDKDTKVVINSFGAELTSIIYKGKERLWQNENKSWKEHAPVLFPHAGKCTINVKGKHYHNLFHGFAKRMYFDIVEQKANSATFMLVNNYYTKLFYPYAFILLIKYVIKNNVLTITDKVVNPSDGNIYFYIGCHESFLLDKEVKNYYIEFEKNEVFTAYQDKIKKPISIKNGKIVMLDSKYLLNSKSIIFENLLSRKVYLKKLEDKSKIAEITYEGFPNLLLWHSKDSRMICIEPWQNLPDAKEDVSKEFKNKKGVISLKPNEERTFIRTIKYF